MKKDIISDIRAFIKFLENCGYTISITVMENSLASFKTELMQYSFHPHSICNYLKKNRGTMGRCTHYKRKLLQENEQDPRYICCYAGVEEFLIPLKYNDTPICYIHISGYRNNLISSAEKAKQIADRCTEQFYLHFNELSQNAPTTKQVLSFITPLEYMLQALYSQHLEMSNQNNLKPARNIYIKALQYIHENYSAQIDCATIASELSYSESYIRYIFKKEGNTSVQSKINEIRLTNAKRLLRSTNLSITQISFSVGFTDSNYFSTFFKNKENMTPREYKKASRS